MLLVSVTVCSFRHSEATRGWMGIDTHFREQATYASPVLKITICLPRICLPASTIDVTVWEPDRFRAAYH
jgi:hypothetical protein